MGCGFSTERVCQAGDRGLSGGCHLISLPPCSPISGLNSQSGAVSGRHCLMELLNNSLSTIHVYIPINSLSEKSSYHRYTQATLLFEGYSQVRHSWCLPLQTQSTCYGCHLTNNGCSLPEVFILLSLCVYPLWVTFFAQFNSGLLPICVCKNVLLRQ